MNRLLKLAATAFLFFIFCLPLTAADAPTLSSIDPTSGVRGNTVTVTLNGTNFATGLAVSAGSGITVANITVPSATLATADFTIAPNANLGAHNVSVTTALGTSGSQTFNVVPPPPTLSGISPASGTLGTSIAVTVTGTNFATGLTVSPGDGITARSVSVINSTTATVTLVIDPGAAQGPRDLTVTTSGGTSGPVSFSVAAPQAPTLSAITPAIGVQNSAMSVVLTGTNFLSGLSVDSISGVTVTGISVTSATSATATFTIAADAELGERAVTVTTGGGTSGTTTFSIAVIPPGLSSISPSAGNQGSTLSVTLAGSNFTPALSVGAGEGIAVSNVSVTNATTATATFAIDAAAALGTRGVAVSTPGGTSAAVPFTVNPPAPTLTGIDNASGVVGSVAGLTLTGTNFYSGLTVNAGTGITVSDITLIDPTTATAALTIGAGAALGARDITVTTASGTSGAVTFTVVPLPPTLTGISPTTVVQSALARSFSVTLTGTNLFSPAVAITGSGVKTSGGVNVLSSTSATAFFTLDANADLGARDVTVTTKGGTSAPIAFTVLPPTPELTTIAPVVGLKGTTVNVTLTGANFVAGVTSIGSIPGITISNTTVVNSLTLTATFAVAAGADAGPRSVTVTTPLGTSAPLTFTVADPFPDISVTSSHTGRFGVGFNETYSVNVTNTGLVPTSGAITVRDTLPVGMTFVSGSGTGWSCTAVAQTVTCQNSDVLAAGATSSYSLTVSVGSSAVGTVNHTVSVTSAGDLNPANDSSSDPTIVAATPSLSFVFDPSPVVAGEQATVAVKPAATFPHDVTGSITLAFLSNAAIPLDDPAIQLATGGRTTTFTIPANATQARFDTASDAGPLAFQTGTVAGRLSFKGTFTAGTVKGSFETPPSSSALTIPLQAPSIQTIETSTDSGFVASIQFFSTSRQVTQLNLTFNTSPKVKLSCGAASGCSASGNTLSFDVTSLLAAWFSSDTTFGGLGVLQLPLNVAGGKVRGTVDVTLRNNQGLSKAVPFKLP